MPSHVKLDGVKTNLSMAKLFCYSLSLYHNERVSIMRGFTKYMASGLTLVEFLSDLICNNYYDRSTPIHHVLVSGSKFRPFSGRAIDFE